MNNYLNFNNSRYLISSLILSMNCVRRRSANKALYSLTNNSRVPYISTSIVTVSELRKRLDDLAKTQT